MGFNSYMAGESMKNEKGLRRAADFMISSGMRDLGYVYVNTDEGWEQKLRNPSSKGLQWNATLYPSGLPAFIESLHKDSLKFGIYGAASGVTCGEDPGQLYYELQDAATYALWGVDFVKSDNCASYALDSSVRYRAMRDALNNTGRAMVLSIEPFSMNPDPSQSSEVANMWRTGVDIGGEFENFMEKADVADKWAPLAGPALGWNDPDMINVRNPSPSKEEEGLTLGENRVYFGLWAIMKAPLLISSDLTKLSKGVLEIITNPDVIRANQDGLGIPARKIQVDGKPLPWLVDVEDCSFPEAGLVYSRKVSRSVKDEPLAGPGTVDTRKWVLQKHVTLENNTTSWLIQNSATVRCLAVGNGTKVVLLPCDASSASQHWLFDKGVSTITSITNLDTRKALGLAESFLYSQLHDKDKFSVSDMAYGLGGLTLVEPYDQSNCTSRWCENYRPEQMWYYSKVDGMLRHSLYTSSINHIRDSQGREDGYVLTQKVPTFRHHCIAHTLSTGSVGTMAGITEVWGGPLEGALIVGFLNRGLTAANITAGLDLLLETCGSQSSESQAQSYSVLDLWEKNQLPWYESSKLTVEVQPRDMKLLQLVPVANKVAPVS